MTLYQGEVQSYTLSISDPKSSDQLEKLDSTQGTFRNSVSLFRARGGDRRPNKKRAGASAFDVDYWMHSWPHFVDMLHPTERPASCSIIFDA